MSKPPKLILHVGSHKTGTSSLQRLLRLSGDKLARHGARYPTVPWHGKDDPSGHRTLGRHLASGQPEQRQKAHAFLQSLRAELSEHERVILSSEELNRYVAVPDGQEGGPGQSAYQPDYFSGSQLYWDRRAIMIERMAEALCGFDTEVWITLRRPDSFCMSMYQQIVKVRFFTGTAREFAGSTHALFDYDRLVRQWAERFDHVRIFVFEDARQRTAGTTGAYLDALGLSSLIPAAQKMGSTNFALHPYTTEFLRLTNYLPLEKDRIRKAILDRVDRSGWPAIRDLVTLDLATRRQINDRYAPACDRLRQDFNVPTPGRDTLFDWDIHDDRPVFEGFEPSMFESILAQLNLQPRRIA